MRGRSRSVSVLLVSIVFRRFLLLSKYSSDGKTTTSFGSRVTVSLSFSINLSTFSGIVTTDRFVGKALSAPRAVLRVVVLSDILRYT